MRWDLRRFPLIGLCQGGAIAIAYAARHPERVSRLVLYDSYLHGAYVGDAGEKLARQARTFAEMIELGWGRKVGAFREMFAGLLMPGAGEREQKWIGELQRHSASPAMARRLWNEFNSFDVRAEAAKVCRAGAGVSRARRRDGAVRGRPTPRRSTAEGPLRAARRSQPHPARRRAGLAHLQEGTG